MCDLYLTTVCGYFTIKGRVTVSHFFFFFVHTLMQPALDLALYWPFIVTWASHPLARMLVHGHFILSAPVTHIKCKQILGHAQIFIWSLPLSVACGASRWIRHLLCKHAPINNNSRLADRFLKLLHSPSFDNNFGSATLGHWPISPPCLCGAPALCSHWQHALSGVLL